MMMIIILTIKTIIILTMMVVIIVIATTKEGAGSRGEAGPNLVHFIRKLKSLLPGFLVTQPTYGYPQVKTILIWHEISTEVAESLKTYS